MSLPPLSASMAFRMSGANNNNNNNDSKKGGYYVYLLKHTHCCNPPSQVNVTIKDYHNEPKVFINGYKGKSITVSVKDMGDILRNGPSILQSIEECQKLCDARLQEEAQSGKRKREKEFVFIMKDASSIQKVDAHVEVDEKQPAKKLCRNTAEEAAVVGKEQQEEA